MILRCVFSSFVLLHCAALKVLILEKEPSSDDVRFKVEVRVLTIILSIAFGLCALAGICGLICFVRSYFRR
ncbi:hypothetical protein QR680_006164 [Steinernema hermaphroditum]|uniref:Uncharacterized protein n=1 Tax=Steinernema hermaphroditum TaxID=289476 RepID=A0AA39LWY5_9BILA|nr:hypothetical protein QR680_006164 [Steinernema hermaphroditum]